MRFLNSVFVTTVLTLSAQAILLSMPSQAADDVAGIQEELPPHLTYRVEGVRNDVLIPGISSAANGIFLRAKAWPPDLDKIQVCFMGGMPTLHKKIRDAARAWENVGAKVKFDFGPEATPRRCAAAQVNHIRIGFAYGGYWSLVGQDSYNLANQNEQSMNFSGFDIAPPPDSEFARIVIHEFGHALGLEHEHQSPFSSCENEFKWDVIYATLASPPNNWPKERVDFNMRALNTPGINGTPFDAQSIMLYTFPASFYKNGTSAACYHKTNYVISSNDGAAMKMLYPVNVAEAVSIRTQDFTAFSDLAAKATKDQGKLVKTLTNFKLMTTTGNAPALMAN